VSLLSAQRSVVATGRHNTAAALSISVLVEAEWTKFLAAVQLSLREQKIDPVVDRVNLGERFEARICEASADLQAVFRGSAGAEADLNLAAFVSVLDGDSSEIEQRIGRRPADPASNLFGSFERLERTASAEQLRRIFFF